MCGTLRNSARSLQNHARTLRNSICSLQNHARTLQNSARTGPHGNCEFEQPTLSSSVVISLTQRFSLRNPIIPSN